jgi:hypothetical protein
VTWTDAVCAMTSGTWNEIDALTVCWIELESGTSNAARSRLSLAYQRTVTVGVCPQSDAVGSRHEVFPELSRWRSHVISGVSHARLADSSGARWA